LIYLQHTVIPLQQLVSFGLNLVSRSFEFQVTFLCLFLLLFHSFLSCSGENGCAENCNVSSLFVIQSNYIAVFHLPLLVSCIHVFRLHLTLFICIFLRRLMALLRSLDIHLLYELVLWNYRWHFNIFASFSWFDASFTWLR